MDYYRKTPAATFELENIVFFSISNYGISSILKINPMNKSGEATAYSFDASR